MAFRPTISVYAGGHIADIGYYRNWEEKSLLYEAAAILSLYGDCRTPEEYRQRKYGRQEVWFNIAPEYWQNTEENLKELEGYSEMPVLVDLDSGSIYTSYGALTAEQLKNKPTAQDFADVCRIHANSPFDILLEYCRIPIAPEMRPEILKILAAWEDTPCYLSTDTMAALRAAYPPAA